MQELNITSILGQKYMKVLNQPNDPINASLVFMPACH